MAIRNKTPWKRRNVPTSGDQGPEALPVQAFQTAVNQLFDDFFTSFEMNPFSVFEDAAGFTPRINMHEGGDEIVITAELPGMDEKDIEISLTRDTLTIKGEKKQESSCDESENYCMERSFGSFRRVVSLPAEVDPDKVNATFRKGVLNIRLPKISADTKGARKIKIRNS